MWQKIKGLLRGICRSCTPPTAGELNPVKNFNFSFSFCVCGCVIRIRKDDFESVLLASHVDSKVRNSQHWNEWRNQICLFQDDADGLHYEFLESAPRVFANIRRMSNLFVCLLMNELLIICILLFLFRRFGWCWFLACIWSSNNKKFIFLSFIVKQTISKVAFFRDPKNLKFSDGRSG